MIQRTYSRILLYSFLGALLLGAFWLHHAMIPKNIVEEWETLPGREEVVVLQEYVRIDTSWPKSNTREAVAFWKRLFDAIGIESSTYQVGPDQFNFVAKIPGGPLPPLILHHHMDVSPVKNLKNWKNPPFGGVIEGPYLWGRGTLDMKHYGVIYYFAIREALEKGWKLRRPIYFIATPTEEMEMVRGTPWLLENKPELFPEGAVFLTEGGGFEVVTDFLKYCGILTYQKEWVFVELGEIDADRIAEITSALLPLFPRDDLVLFPGYELILNHLAPHRIAYRDILENVGKLYRDDQEKLKELPEPYLDLMRRSFSIHQRMGPDKTRLVLSLLPGDEPEEWIDRVGKVLSSMRQSYSISFASPKLNITPSNTDAFRSIQDSILEVFPAIDTGPYATPWKMNEGQYLRKPGYLSYGIAFVPINIFDMTHAGAADERIHLVHYMKGMDLGKAIVKHLAGDAD